MLSGYVRTHFHIVYYGNFIVFIEISGLKNTFVHWFLKNYEFGIWNFPPSGHDILSYVPT